MPCRLPPRKHETQDSTLRQHQVPSVHGALPAEEEPTVPEDTLSAPARIREGMKEGYSTLSIQPSFR